MKIEILGMGCATCNKLEDTVRLAVGEMGIEAQIDHVKDIKKIMTYGVMTTPALVIDGVVKAAGKLPSLADIKQMIGSK
ncbi:MAG: thioredoxin family protein [Deltaproteobacteria bacterium HGW-Deltaproteobacteria-10]|nr:MAG: thioredoxin family protein [Deltaproteobacteria bacterium HGW-Deltaproteobacteria-10]